MNLQPGQKTWNTSDFLGMQRVVPSPLCSVVKRCNLKVWAIFNFVGGEDGEIDQLSQLLCPGLEPRSK